MLLKVKKITIRIQNVKIQHQPKKSNNFIKSTETEFFSY
jgi:hypothetical protein